MRQQAVFPLIRFKVIQVCSDLLQTDVSYSGWGEGSKLAPLALYDTTYLPLQTGEFTVQVQVIHWFCWSPVDFTQRTDNRGLIQGCHFAIADISQFGLDMDIGWLKLCTSLELAHSSGLPWRASVHQPA